jgi:type VI secretion system secreted protein VgrG
VTPKPFVQGPQTAIVVGPSGEEIYTDKYGRVKVQFHWDRLGKRDENSSCWVRVSQPWAGKNWGTISLPRVGQEVIIDFLEGDPDQPIVTGRVYNGEQMPPYALPANQTRSTTKSRSSKGGSASNYNEIRFEDKMGSEQIFINAEKDLDLRVENDSREYVGGDRSLLVNANQRELVNGDQHGHVKGSRFEKIEGDMSVNFGGKRMAQTGGDESISIGGDRKEQVSGTLSLQVGKDCNEQVGGGLSLQVGQSRNEKIGQTHAMEAGQVIHLKAGQTVVIEAGVELTLKGPGGFVDIGPAGVTIQGTMVLINSGGSGASGPGASPQSPVSPEAPKDPKEPDKADDGTKGGKLS